MNLKKLLNNPLTYIIIASPFLLYAITLLLPVHDDWSYCTTPYYDFGEKFIYRVLPWYSYWRPWDGLFGYFLSLHKELFPTLNHIAVYTAHLVCTFLIYRLSGTLGFKTYPKNISTIFFFISPAMLGTVFGIDSLNQAYAQMWGLAATTAYIEIKNKWRVPLWLALALIGTFSKENGITFFVIPQLLAWSMGRITLRQAVKDTVWAALVVVAYFSTRIALTNTNVYINDAYLENTITRKLKNVAVFIGMTWIPLDYVSLWHAPNRNLLIVALTLIISTPFIIYIFFSKPKNLLTREALGLIACMLIAASPHLVTLFTAMHPYASLGISALIVGYLTDKMDNKKLLYILFAMFIASTMFVDWHHWQKSYESGMTGKKMGEEAVRKINKPVDKVYIITIDRGETKYSSFCAIPNDAFGWGLSMYAETGYKWPETIFNTSVKEKETYKIDSIAEDALAKGYEKVILVHGDTVDVIR